MLDFIVDTVAEIVDFFLDFWVDKVIAKFTKRMKRSEGDSKISMYRKEL